MPVKQIPITDHQAWLDLRKTYITASEVAALYGCHRFMTVAELYAEKKGVLPVQKDSVVKKRGRAMEQVCADEVGEQRNKWRITKAQEFLADDERRMGATPDFYIEDNSYHLPKVALGILETKIVSRSAFEREWSDDLPPLDVILQTTQQMLLADADFGAVGALVIGEYEFECHVYDIPRHNPTEYKLIMTVQDFWKAFDEGRMPEFDYAKDRAVLKALFPTPIVGKSVDLSHDNRLYELLIRCDDLKAKLESIEPMLEMIENEVIHKIGDAETATCGPWSVSYKLQQRKAYSVAATQYRVLRTKQT